MFDISPMLKQPFTVENCMSGKNAEVAKEDIEKLLIKYGNNPHDVKKMIEKEFDAAVRMHPSASASKIAEIIRTLY